MEAVGLMGGQGDVLKKRWLKKYRNAKEINPYTSKKPGQNWQGKTERRPLSSASGTGR